MKTLFIIGNSKISLTPNNKIHIEHRGKSGIHIDYPIIYDNLTVAFDDPTKLPAYTRVFIAHNAQILRTYSQEGFIQKRLPMPKDKLTDVIERHDNRCEIKVKLLENGGINYLNLHKFKTLVTSKLASDLLEVVKKYGYYLVEYDGTKIIFEPNR